MGNPKKEIRIAVAICVSFANFIVYGSLKSLIIITQQKIDFFIDIMYHKIWTKQYDAVA